ncbi:hypothetical protein BRADI_2g37641v3 [Brachypodium distachyon]|uniref:Uncharacterized protein n=1 Tax=Brachypodium distachyon TaxID=15368 RepID=A0A2K2DCC9_BRADI|nr:hypothetical protein BRADI_2g37641v3 [Brachypodium distachyon]
MEKANEQELDGFERPGGKKECLTWTNEWAKPHRTLQMVCQDKPLACMAACSSSSCCSFWFGGARQLLRAKAGLYAERPQNPQHPHQSKATWGCPLRQGLISIVAIQSRCMAFEHLRQRAVVLVWFLRVHRTIRSGVVVCLFCGIFARFL